MFKHARQNLENKAAKIKDRSDEKMHDLPNHVGDDVYVRNRGFTGRHKLQYIWNNSKFRVTNVQDSVYTVQSGDGLKKTLNRRDIKRCPSHPHLPVQDS